MPVHDVEAVLREYITARLNEMLPEDVTANFAFGQYINICDCECEDEEAFTVEPVWRLNLHLVRQTSEDKFSFINLTGLIPFHLLASGDTKALEVLLDQMWADQQFGWVMASEQELGESLEKMSVEFGDSGPTA